MVPLINSGDECTVEPYTNQALHAGKSIVLCKVNGHPYIHLITAIRGDQVQISNNHGHVNGWTRLKNVYGLLIAVVP